MRRVAGAFALLVAAFLVLGRANAQDFIISGLDDDPKLTPGCNPEADKLRRQYDEIKTQIKQHVADLNDAAGTIRRAEVTLEDVKRYKRYPDQKPDDFDLQAEEADANADKLKAEETLKRIKEILLPPLLDGHGKLKEKIEVLQKQCEPAGLIDKCLVGKWQSTEGIQVTFKADGTQTIDYANMKPFIAGKDRITFTGTTTGLIEAQNNIAVLKKILQSSLKMTLFLGVVGHDVAVWDLKDRLGPGALGEATGNNAYACTEETLTYQGTTHRDKRPTWTLRFTRIKE